MTTGYKNPSASKRMTELWSDPDWRRKTAQKIRDGHAKNRIGPPTGYRRRGVWQLTLCFRDEALKNRFCAQAAKQGLSLSALAEAYIEWGLELEEGIQDE